MRRQLLGVLLLLSGCKGCRPEDELPDVLFAVDAAAVGVVVGEAQGPAPLTVPVLAVNLLGAVVPADGVTVGGDAPLASATPSVDGTGWGGVAVTEAGRWTVSASFAGASAEASAWVVADEPPAWGLPAVDPGAAPEAVALAGSGAAWSVGGAVWWAPLTGGGPVRVLDLPTPVTGMLAAQLDGDGVPDLVAWSEGHVVALRGRAEGGLTWLGGWAVDEGTVVGAATALSEGDAEPDLVVAVTGGGTTRVAWLDGGAGSWAYADLLEVGYTAWGLSTEDLDADGAGEITLLTSDGLLRRYAKVDGGWSPTGGGEFTLDLGEGARLLASEDLDGDGIEDLVALGPDVATGSWQSYVVSTPDRQLYRMFTATKNDRAPTSLRGAVEDLDGDGRHELVLVTDRDLRRAAWNDAVSTFDLFLYDTLPGGVPFALGDTTGDGVQDVLFGGATLGLREGERDGGGWNVWPVDGERLDLGLVGAPWVGDADGDGIVDLVSFADTGSGLQVRAWLGEAGAFATVGSVALPEDAVALDLAVCDGEVFALVDEDDGPTLWHAELDPVDGLVGGEWGIRMGGETVACRDGWVAVAGADGELWWLPDGASPYQDEGWTEPVVDLALAGGEDQPRAVACAEAGCSIVAADLDGDGVDEVAVGGVGGVRLEGGASSRPGPGALTAADADGDGVLDLLAADGDAARVYRLVDGALSPARTRTVASPVDGPMGLGDLDGDGRADLFAAGRADDDDESWAGTLLHLRAP